MSALRITLLLFAILLTTCGPPSNNQDSHQDDASPAVEAPLSIPSILTVRDPEPQEIIRSPYTVEGKAVGNWYHEGSFTLRLYATDGQLLSTTQAQAQADWRTDELVFFQAILSFSYPEEQQGELVLEKANPSGLPEHAQEYRIPVRFP